MASRDSFSRFKGAYRAPPRGRGGPPHRRNREDRDGPAILYGWHTVTLALANPNRKIRKLFVTETALRRLTEENIALNKLTPEVVRPSVIDQRLGPDAVHQGLLAAADALPALDIDPLPQG